MKIAADVTLGVVIPRSPTFVGGVASATYFGSRPVIHFPSSSCRSDNSCTSVVVYILFATRWLTDAIAVYCHTLCATEIHRSPFVSYLKFRSGMKLELATDNELEELISRLKPIAKKLGAEIRQS